MKPGFFFIAIIIFPFACHFSKNDVEAVSGTYVRVLDTEINVVYDTLNFSPASEGAGDLYRIDQRSSTQFIKEEDQGFNKKSNWNISGTYNSKHRVMQTPDPGIVYSFDLEKGTVTINAITYQKLK